MILVFALVFIFILGYLKEFSGGKRPRMILAVAVFSLLVSFLFSFLSVYGFYMVRNPVLDRLSLPFHWTGAVAIIGKPPPSFTTSGIIRIFFADKQLWEIDVRAHVIYTEEKGYVLDRPLSRQPHSMADLLSYQLPLIFTALNMIGAPLGAFTYRLNEKFVKRLWRK